MADERYHWLDGDAAERLLRGEPLDAVDDHARTEADRLSAALGAVRFAHPREQPEEAREHADPAGVLPGRFPGALPAEVPDGAAGGARRGLPGDMAGELPGEAGALAAFRAARATYATRVDDASEVGTVLGDSGSVHIGPRTARPRTRWGRPVRYGLAAALAACTLGGAAMAGAGVIPSPFGGRDEPGHDTSVSAAPTEPGPLLSPSPGTSASDRDATDGGSATPDGDASPGSGDPSRGGTDPSASQGGAPSPADTDRHRAGRKEWYARLVTGCRDYLDGEPMDPDKKRRIERAAKGPDGARNFCIKVLAADEGKGGGRGGSGDGKGGDQRELNGESGPVVSVTSATPTSVTPSSVGPSAADTTPDTVTDTATDTTSSVDGVGSP